MEETEDIFLSLPLIIKNLDLCFGLFFNQRLRLLLQALYFTVIMIVFSYPFSPRVGAYDNLF
jgi:hypothetical protein